MTEHQIVRLQIIGALLAAGLAATLAIAALGLLESTMLAIAGVIGVPVGATLGWQNAPRVRAQAAAQAFDTALAMSVRAVVLGDLGVTLLMIVPAAAGDGPPALAAVVLMPIVGLLIFGLPAFAVAFLVLWPWGRLIRALPAGLVLGRPA